MLGAVGLTALAWLSHYPPAVVDGSQLPMSRDSGTFAYAGWQIAHRALPLRDIWDHKPPGIDYLDAVVLLVGGNRLESIVVFDLVFGVLVLAAAFWCLRQVASLPAAATTLVVMAAVARAPSILEGGNFTEEFAQLPMLLAYGCVARLLQPQRGRGLWTAVAAGLFCGAAVLLKPTAISPIVVLALLAAIAVARRQDRPLRPGPAHLLLATATMAVVVGMVVIAYATQGGLHALVETNLTYNRLYAPRANFGLALGFLGFVGRTWPLALWVLLLFALLAAPRVLARVPAPPGAPLTTALVFFALAVDSLALAAQGRFYAHYALGLVPALGMITAWAIDRLLRANKPEMRRPAYAIAAVLLGALVVVACIGLVGADDLSLPRVRAAMNRQPIAESPLIKRVDMCPAPAEVYVWGAEPEINFLSLRKSPSRYVYLYPLQMPAYDNRARVDQLVDDLSRNPPCVVVDTSAVNSLIPPLDQAMRVHWTPSTDYGGAYRYTEFAPIYELLARRYPAARRVGPYVLWCAAGAPACDR